MGAVLNICSYSLLKSPGVLGGITSVNSTAALLLMLMYPSFVRTRVVFFLWKPSYYETRILSSVRRVSSQ